MPIVEIFQKLHSNVQFASHDLEELLIVNLPAQPRADGLANGRTARARFAADGDGKWSFRMIARPPRCFGIFRRLVMSGGAEERFADSFGNGAHVLLPQLKDRQPGNHCPASYFTLSSREFKSIGAGSRLPICNPLHQGQ